MLVDSQHRIDRREFLGRQTHLQRDGGEIHRGILRHQTSQHSAVGTSATAGVAGALHGDAPLLAHKRDDAVEETVVDLGDLLVHAFVALGELLDLLLLGHATLHRFRLGQELFDLVLAQKAEALAVAVVQAFDGDALFLGRVDIEVHELRELGRGHGVGHLPRSSLRARGRGEAKGCRKNKNERSKTITFDEKSMHDRKRSGTRLCAEHRQWTKYSRVYKAPAAASLVILRKLDFMDPIVKSCRQSRPLIRIHFPTCICH